MQIAGDGTWFYMGTPIGRPALVRLFSTILKREDGKHLLVTPVEKVGIRVDDAPFLAVEMRKENRDGGRLLHFRTNVDDWVACDAAHRLRFEAAADGGLTPYLHVRADLWAKVTRALITRLTSARSEWSMAIRCSASPRRASSLRWRIRAGEGSTLNEPMLKSGHAISSAEFFDRARARLGFGVPPGLVDPDIVPRGGDPGYRPDAGDHCTERPVRPAAVLIPVVDHPQPTVLLTQRSARLSDHAGQISFPGGKIDATDATPLDAALREAFEEVGPEREFIDPIGYLDLYATSSDSASCRRSRGSSPASGCGSTRPKSTMPSRCRWRS